MNTCITLTAELQQGGYCYETMKAYIILDTAMSFNTDSAEITTSFTALIKRHAGYGHM